MHPNILQSSLLSISHHFPQRSFPPEIGGAPPPPPNSSPPPPLPSRVICVYAREVKSTASVQSRDPKSSLQSASVAWHGEEAGQTFDECRGLDKRRRGQLRLIEWKQKLGWLAAVLRATRTTNRRYILGYVGHTRVTRS